MTKQQTVLTIVVIVILLTGGILWSKHYQFDTIATVEATVTRAERVTTGSGETISSAYLVFTDKETFKNADAFWHGKYNSSDLHGKLKSGSSYEFTVYGYRRPMWSQYRNIIKAKLLSDPAEFDL